MTTNRTKEQASTSSQPLRPHIYDMTSSASFERASAPSGFRGGSRTPKRLPSQAASSSTPSTSAPSSARSKSLRRSTLFSSHHSTPEPWDIPGRAISSQSIRRPLESASMSDLLVGRGKGTRSFTAPGSRGKVFLPGNLYQNPDPASSWGFASPSPSRPSTALSAAADTSLAPAEPRAAVYIPDRPWTESSALSALRSSLSAGAGAHQRPHVPGSNTRSSLMSADSMGPASASPHNLDARPAAEPSMSSQGRYFEFLLGGRPVSQPQAQPQPQPQDPRPSSSCDSPALQRSTLNGIGHPSSRLSISIPHISVQARDPDEPLASSPRRDCVTPQVREVQQDVSDEGLSIMLASPHWRHRPAFLSLVAKPQPDPGAAAAAAAQRLADEEESRRRALDKKEGWLPARAPGFVSTRSSRPVGEDPLNLWRGKRLTAAEMKVEKQLHALRMNPGAKASLEKRVSTYQEEKQQGNADRAAKAKVAMESQLQRAAAVVARLG